MMNKLIKSTLVLTAIFLLTACGSVESDLSGVWINKAQKDLKPEQLSESFEFFSDHTLTMKTKPRHVVIPYQGRWAILDDGRIKIDVDAPLIKIVFMGSLNGSELSLKNGFAPTTIVLVKQ